MHGVWGHASTGSKASGLADEDSRSWRIFIKQIRNLNISKNAQFPLEFFPNRWTKNIFVMASESSPSVVNSWLTTVDHTQRPALYTSRLLGVMQHVAVLHGPLVSTNSCSVVHHFLAYYADSDILDWSQEQRWNCPPSPIMDWLLDTCAVQSAAALVSQGRLWPRHQGLVQLCQAGYLCLWSHLLVGVHFHLLVVRQRVSYPMRHVGRVLISLTLGLEPVSRLNHLSLWCMSSAEHLHSSEVQVHIFLSASWLVDEQVICDHMTELIEILTWELTWIKVTF